MKQQEGNHRGRDKNWSKEEELCKQHEQYLNTIHQSGVPMWVADMYQDMSFHSQPKPIDHEPDNKTNQSDDSEPDPHMFI